MTEAEVQKLRDRGVSDAVILDLQKEEAEAQGQAAPAANVTSELPRIDPNTPSRVYSQAQSTNTPTEGSGQTFGQTVLELAPAVGGAAIAAAPYAAGAAGLYGGGKLLGIANRAAEAYKTGVATNSATQELRVLERLARGVGPEAEQAKQALTEFLQKSKSAMAPAAAPAAAPPAAAPPAAPAAPMRYGQPGMPTASYNVPTGGVPGMPAAPTAAPQDPFARTMQNADRVLRQGAPQMAPQMAPPAAPAQPGVMSRMLSAAAPYVRTAARFAGPAGILYEGLGPTTANAGEQQQLAQMQSPESVAETQRNRQAIALAGRQPTSAADLDQMIRAAAAKRALMMGPQGR